MPTLSITISTAQAQRLRAAAIEAGYPGTDAGAVDWITEWMKQTVLTIERRKAQEAVAPPPDFT